LAEIGLVYIHLADKEGAPRVDIPMQSVYDFFLEVYSTQYIKIIFGLFRPIIQVLKIVSP
jgi:hypothetical protein